MAAARRWDTDTRGFGVADAREAVPDLQRLLDACAIDGWVAEDPEAHLQPHLDVAATSLGLRVRGSRTVDGVFEITIERGERSEAELRALALALAGSVAEASTHVRQVGETRFDVVTGMLPGDSPVFSTHGHLVRIRFE